MVRFVSPPLNELHTLRTPLNEGEQMVLDFFVRNLPEAWEIYIQPHLNGLRPDFVLLNPKVGIAVYEVKHWNLNAMPYQVKYSEKVAELWATNPQGVDFRVTDNPALKIRLYKDCIANLYAPEIGKRREEGDTGFNALITGGVIFTKANTEEVEDLLAPFFTSSSEERSKKSKEYFPISGIDRIQSNNLRAVLPAVKWNRSKFMSDTIATQLRRWLVEPDFSQEQRQSLILNSKQKSLATSRTKSGYRRIRGAAGSGKSLVLAARAAHLSAQNKEVLIVTFNITLWHYLRDLVVRYPLPGVRLNRNVTYMHFHQWCKEIIITAGMEAEYKHLFKGGITDSTLEKDMPKLANRAIDRIEANARYGQPPLNKYYAVLIDEGQDYNILWWNTLERVRQPKGEMLLVADESQDLYERAKKWTEEEMTGAGFRGPWSQLDICYRSPSALVPYLKEFAERFLPDSKISLINSDSEELDIYPVFLRWVQVPTQSKLPSACAEAALQIPEVADPDIVAYPDLVALLPNHSLGLSFVKLLEQQGLNCLHIFDPNKREQKSKKMSFFMGDARVKACTIHSFKGWEARYMVIGISQATDLAAYVAMSRLKRHTGGSYLTVVCSDPKLESYGQTWPAENDIAERGKSHTFDYKNVSF
ncbi:MAG: UvrD-helicase domain-containing protein [Cyanobacteria bacterium J06623_4]